MVHKKKTVESFRFVKEDISKINIALENLRNTLIGFETKLAALDSHASALSASIGKCSSDIRLQQSNSLSLWSKLDNTNKSAVSAVSAASLLKDRISGLDSKNKAEISRINSHSSLIKKLAAELKSQSMKNKKLNSELKSAGEETNKLRKFINVQLRILKRRSSKAEARAKKKPKLFSSLKKTAKKKGVIAKRKSPKARARKNMRQGKTIITVKTPQKTIVEAVTPTRHG
ncbi:hypothetical protein HYY71_01600 [Candidatus Woesearchaeota archaeon]|nr:hypothetical protein [Candidatus Woesearchaeota archaeon]